MNATMEAPEKVEDMTADEARDLAVKDEKGRARRGLQRKVHFLWGGRDFAYVRVNFHNIDMDNYIVKSDFFRVEREGGQEE